jgi:hypothetical protein
MINVHDHVGLGPKRDISPFHSITLSLVASSAGGTVTPSVSAALRLIIPFHSPPQAQHQVTKSISDLAELSRAYDALGRRQMSAQGKATFPYFLRTSVLPQKADIDCPKPLLPDGCHMNGNKVSFV